MTAASEQPSMTSRRRVSDDVDGRPAKQVKTEASNLEREAREKDAGLSVEERKANHIASEHRRRGAIRLEFDKLTEVVPDLNSAQSRSETVVLAKTVEFLKRVIKENNTLKELAASHSIVVAPDSRP